MILASAQTRAKGNVNDYLTEHCHFVKLSIDEGADVIVFPELSLIGYEIEKATDLAFTEHDSRLAELRKMSAKYKVVIIAGAPIKISNKLYIGSFVIKPDYTIDIYTKQFVHGAENQYFDSSVDHNPVIEIQNERLSVAICADINYPAHPQNAVKNRTTIYIASIFFELHEMNKAYNLLSGYSRSHAMNVLMSNYAGQCRGLEAGGQSGFWDNRGKLIANLNHNESGLLVIVKNENAWSCKTIMC